MISIALVIIYSILLLLHTFGTLFNARVSWSTTTKIDNLAYLAQFRISLIFGIGLIWTDVLTIYLLVSGNKFHADVEYIEALNTFLYIVPFAHFGILRIISIFRRIAIKFYKEFVYLLFIRIFLASTIFVGGIALCKLSSNHFVPVFSAAYFAFFGVLNTVMFSTIKMKMKQVNLYSESTVVPAAASASASAPAAVLSSKKSVSSWGSSRRGNAEARRERRKATYDEALKEITVTVKVAGINALIAAITTGILFGVFNDGTFQSGTIVALPFKVMAAITIIALAKIEAGKISDEQ